MVNVRRACKQDEEAIFRFIKQAYKGRWQYKIPYRWQWEFVENPFLDDEELPIFIAIDDDGQVVGQVCTMVERIKIGESVNRIGWSVDNYVLPHYRKQGIASALQKANYEDNEIFLSLSMADIVRKIKTSMGMVPLPPVGVYRRYHKLDKDIVRHAILAIFTPVPGLRRKMLSGGMRFLLIDRILALLRGALLQWEDRCLRRMIEPGLNISACEKFPDGVNRLLEDLSRKFDAIIQRDCLYLNWKFVEQPHMNYQRFLARRDGEMSGYLIVRVGRPPEPRIGILADIFVDPLDDATLFSLLAYAISYFREEKVSEIHVASSVTEYQKKLEDLGFIKEREEIPMINMKSVPPLLKPLIDSGTWFFGTSDHDFDQYPLAK